MKEKTEMQITRTELAKRWHVGLRAVKAVLKQGELKSSLAIGYKNQKTIVIDLKDVEAYEKLKNIPKDPISLKETGLNSNQIYRFKRLGRIKHFYKINNQTTIYSRSEFKWLVSLWIIKI